MSGGQMGGVACGGGDASCTLPHPLPYTTAMSTAATFLSLHSPTWPLGLFTSTTLESPLSRQQAPHPSCRRVMVVQGESGRRWRAPSLSPAPLPSPPSFPSRCAGGLLPWKGSFPYCPSFPSRPLAAFQRVVLLCWVFSVVTDVGVGVGERPRGYIPSWQEPTASRRGRQRGWRSHEGRSQLHSLYLWGHLSPGA